MIIQRNKKKNLMYVSGEDFYFFTYCVIIILKTLGCKKDKYFKDYRKIAYIIEFVSNSELMDIINRNMERKIKNDIDKDHLFNSYTNALMRQKDLLRLLFMLENKNILSIRKNNVDRLIDVSLNEQALDRSFYDKRLFATEIENISKFKIIFKRTSVLTLETMLSDIYEKHGIKLWAI